MHDLLTRTLGEAIEIELVVAAGLWQCEVDPGQLENAILNLSINARDAMLQGGKLTIETSNAHLDDTYAAAQEEVEPGQYVLLAVSDTGMGMSAEVIPQAFEPFFTTKEVGKGSGLGLSMIHGFVKQSRGHVRIYSELGEGTTMKIYFPRSAADSVSGYEAVAPAIVDPSARGEVVMVVEDDVDVRTVAVSILDELGYEILEAGTAVAALELIERSRQLDLLITDVVLPGGSGGRELVDRALALMPDLKVLYMSGYTKNAIMHHGRLDEGVQLLTKPFGRAAFALKVRQILDNKV
jgi:CheY-like chemotaxis protein